MKEFGAQLNFDDLLQARPHWSAADCRSLCPQQTAQPREANEFDERLSCDAQDPFVAFQHRLDPWWNQAVCFLLPSIYAQLKYGDFWTGFFVLGKWQGQRDVRARAELLVGPRCACLRTKWVSSGCLRWCICLNATWTVNSTAHLWGDRRYQLAGNPCESTFTSVVAVGEGWHDWHHKYPYDYAAAEGGAWAQYNPSKVVRRQSVPSIWETTNRKTARLRLMRRACLRVFDVQLIDTAAFFGFVWDRRRALGAWAIRKAELEREAKHRRQLEAEVVKNSAPLAAAQAIREELEKEFAKVSVWRSLVRRSLLGKGTGIETQWHWRVGRWRWAEFPLSDVCAAVFDGGFGAFGGGLLGDVRVVPGVPLFLLALPLDAASHGSQQLRAGLSLLCASDASLRSGGGAFQHLWCAELHRRLAD